MASSVSLSDATLAVEPGSAVSTQLRVRNTGDVVDQFNFQPLGEAAAWITVEPPSIRLFPNTDETVTVTIAPPRSSDSKPGVTAWAVKAIPSEDPGGAAVGEGTVDVAEFSVIEAELQPVAGRGRLVGRFEIAVDNRGNIPMQVRLTGTDAEQALSYEFADDIIATEPGTAHFTKLKLRPAERIWRGQPKSHPFQILAEPQQRSGGTASPSDAALDDAAPTGSGHTVEGDLAVLDAPTVQTTLLNGTLLQEPILPKWLWKAVLLLLALLLVLFILWKTLLKPQVESAARAVAVEEVDQVEEQVAELEDQVDEVAEVADVAQESAVGAEEAAAAAEEAAAAEGGGGGGGESGLATVFNETSAPSNARLTVTADPGATATTGGGTLPADTTFALTDVILQNPGGAVGRIRIQLGGETILESALENFRDLDFHFVSPYIVEGGQELALEIDCAADQVVAGTACDAAVSFAGFTTETTESS